MADHRRELHPDAREAGQAAERGRGPEILRLVLQERAEACRGAGLRAASGQRDEPDRGRVEIADQGRERQGPLELIRAASRTSPVTFCVTGVSFDPSRSPMTAAA